MSAVNNHPFLVATNQTGASSGPVTIKEISGDTIRFSDNSVYTGDIQDGQATGKGKRVYPPGGVMQSDEGTFLNGELNGRGTRNMVGGTGFTQIGEFKLGQFWNGEERISNRLAANYVDGVRKAPKRSGCSLL